MQDKAAFTPPSLLLATIALSLATFMQVLDTTIANVALPTIAGNLGVSSTRDPGYHLVCSLQCHRTAVDRVVYPALWATGSCLLDRSPLYSDLVPVRLCP